jgi:hypothetical protein
MARSRKAAVTLPAEPIQYQVTRTLRLSPTVVLQPGARLTPGVDWPYRRVKQFVDQGFLAPVQVVGAAEPSAPAAKLTPGTKLFVEDTKADDEAADAEQTE